MSTSLETLIQQKREQSTMDAAPKSPQHLNEFKTKREALLSMFEQIKQALTPLGFTVNLENGPAHAPCPAIHVGNLKTYDLVKSISIISRQEPNFKDETLWLAGVGLDMNRFRFKSDAELLEHIAESVAHIQPADAPAEEAGMTLDKTYHLAKQVGDLIEEAAGMSLSNNETRDLADRLATFMDDIGIHVNRD